MSKKSELKSIKRDMILGIKEKKVQKRKFSSMKCLKKKKPHKRERKRKIQKSGERKERKELELRKE